MSKRIDGSPSVNGTYNSDMNDKDTNVEYVNMNGDSSTKYTGKDNSFVEFSISGGTDSIYVGTDSASTDLLVKKGPTNDFKGATLLSTISGGSGPVYNDVNPSSDDTYSLGSSSKKWKESYISTLHCPSLTNAKDIVIETTGISTSVSVIATKDITLDGAGLLIGSSKALPIDIASTTFKISSTSPVEIGNVSITGALTCSDLASKSAIGVGNSLTVDGNVIPKTSAKQTVGDGTHLYTDGYVTTLHSDTLTSSNVISITSSKGIALSSTGVTTDAGILPTTDGTLNLGSAVKQFNELYLKGNITAGGISFTSAPTFSSSVDAAGAIKFDSSGGTKATIRMLEQKGTSNAAITLESQAGGITMIAKNGIIVKNDVLPDGTITIGSKTAPFTTEYVKGITVDSSALTISTTTSGNIVLNPSGNVTITNDLLPATGTYSLGNTGNPWKNIDISGTATLPTIAGTTATIATVNCGTVVKDKGNLDIKTTTSGDLTLTSAGKIILANDIIGVTTDTQSLGTSGVKFKDLYLSGTGIIPTVSSTSVSCSTLSKASGSLDIKTTTSGDITITSAGKIILANDVQGAVTDTQSLGTSSVKFKDLYLSGSGTIPTMSSTTVNVATVNNTSADLTVKTTTSGDLILYPFGNTRSRGHILAYTDATFDIGSGSYQFRDLYLSRTLYSATSISAPLITRASGNLALTTTTSGDITFNSVGSIIFYNTLMPSATTKDIGSAVTYWSTIYVNHIQGITDVVTPLLTNTTTLAITSSAGNITLTPTSYVRIDGNLTTNLDATNDFGSGSFQWRDGYFSRNLNIATQVNTPILNRTSGDLLIKTTTGGNVTITPVSGSLNLNANVVLANTTQTFGSGTYYLANLFSAILTSPSLTYGGNMTIATTSSGNLTINAAGTLNIDTDADTSTINIGVVSPAQNKNINIGNNGTGLTTIYTSLYVSKSTDTVSYIYNYNAKNTGARESYYRQGCNGGGELYLYSNYSGSTRYGIPNGYSGLACTWGDFYIATGGSGTGTQRLKITSGATAYLYSSVDMRPITDGSNSLGDSSYKWLSGYITTLNSTTVNVGTVNNTAGNLLLQTTTSGDVTITPASGNVNLNASIVLADSLKTFGSATYTLANLYSAILTCPSLTFNNNLTISTTGTTKNIILTPTGQVTVNSHLVAGGNYDLGLTGTRWINAFIDTIYTSSITRAGTLGISTVGNYALTFTSGGSMTLNAAGAFNIENDNDNSTISIGYYDGNTTTQGKTIYIGDTQDTQLYLYGDIKNNPRLYTTTMQYIYWTVYNGKSTGNRCAYYDCGANAGGGIMMASNYNGAALNGIPNGMSGISSYYGNMALCAGSTAVEVAELSSTYFRFFKPIQGPSGGDIQCEGTTIGTGKLDVSDYSTKFSVAGSHYSSVANTTQIKVEDDGTGLCNATITQTNATFLSALKKKSYYFTYTITNSGTMSGFTLSGICSSKALTGAAGTYTVVVTVNDTAGNFVLTFTGCSSAAVMIVSGFSLREYTDNISLRGDGLKQYGASITNISLMTDGSIETGTIMPFASDTYNIGSSGVHYDSMYANAFTVPSDARLKQNVVQLGLGLSFIRGLNPIMFEYKAKPAVKHYGFIAQDIADDVLVKREEFLSVNVSEMIPVLVNAVKELSETRIETQVGEAKEVNVYCDGEKSDDSRIRIVRGAAGMYTIDYSLLNLKRNPCVFVQVVNAQTVIATIVSFDIQSAQVRIVNDKGMKTNSQFFVKIAL